MKLTLHTLLGRQIEVEYTPVTIYGVTFAVHPSYGPVDEQQAYSVSDIETGFAVAAGKSPNSAIRNARGKLREAMAEHAGRSLEEILRKRRAITRRRATMARKRGWL